MVLNEIASDCKLISDFFEDINDFIFVLNTYKQKYSDNFFHIILKLSQSKTDPFLRELCDQNINYVNMIYNLTKAITTCTLKTVKVLAKFPLTKLHSDTIKEQLEKFLKCMEEFIEMCNMSSISINSQEKFNYASKLYIKFEEIYYCYIALYSSIELLKSTISELYNEIPEQIQNNHNYIELNIQSNKETSDLKTISKDIELMSNIIINIQAILPEDIPKDYYIQKVESGSILLSIITAVPLFKQIVATIDYCSTIFYKHRNNHIDLKMKETQLEQEQLKLKHEQFELEKKQFELDLLKKYQELGFDIENNGEHLEQIEKIIATTMKYLSSNPSGKLNNEKYNIQSQPTLLTDRILQNMPNNEPEVSISD